MNFKGKTALITGASVGIGRATALKFAEYGADVAILDLNGERLQKTAQEVSVFGGKVLPLTVDVSDEQAIKAACLTAEQTLGKIDILINNAGIWRVYTKFAETDSSVWRKMLDVNVMGTVFATQAVLPGMLRRNYGKIVNVASVAGVYGNATMSAYSATKGALISFTKALAKEVAAKGVVVNAISPGTVNSSKNDDIYATEKSDACFAARTGSAAENANLICFLCSDLAPYVCGQNIQIDGCRLLTGGKIEL